MGATSQAFSTPCSSSQVSSSYFPVAACERIHVRRLSSPFRWASLSRASSDSSCESREIQLAQFQMGLLEMGERCLQLRGAALGCGRRIVQFVGHARTEFAQCRQFFALPQHDLLLQVGLLQVAKLFLLQAGVQTCPQQHRIEGLGQVVLGPHFNAAHGAVHLVQCRNDNDRNVPQLGIALDCFPAPDSHPSRA